MFKSPSFILLPIPLLASILAYIEIVNTHQTDTVHIEYIVNIRLWCIVITMSDRIVHLVEVAADHVISPRNPNQAPMRFIATVNRFNNIVHGAARPEDQLDQTLHLQAPKRRYIELAVEQDSDEAGPAFRPGKYTATVDEHNIIVHGAARSDDRDGVSSSPDHHATSPAELREMSRRARFAEVLHSSEDEDNDSDSTAEGEVDAIKHRSTRGIAERVKTANTYINRRQKSAISRPGPDAEGKFIVEGLLAQIRNPDDENDPKMLVKWEGYGLEEATYELRSMLLEDAPAEVRKFDARQSRSSDETSLSPLNPQSWPTGLSETAFRDLDVASQDANAATASEASHSVVVRFEETDSEDDDVPIPRRSSKTATSTHMRSPLQPMTAALQRTRHQSPDSLFDGPTPDPSFWTASPEPQTTMPESVVRPRSDRKTPGLFVTPGPEAMRAARSIAGAPAKPPARARLGEGFSVPEGTRTNKPQRRANVDGLGSARSSSGGQAPSARLTPQLNSGATAFQPDHRMFPASNKRKQVRPARPISPKRPKFHGLE